ncbi:MAG: 8-amino-7-oxononanoate synthase [Verrucomicrobiales bacterium]|nr:8-amino-7-oxononanoate synthase [Verrucomicrobiales bacterium]
MRDPDSELNELDQTGLRRQLRRIDSPQGVEITLTGSGKFLNFSSNDYLGLANHPANRESLKRNIDRYGTGSGASRLVCGSQSPHHELEEKLAALKNAEAALTFGSGFATATGAIPALCEKSDIVILDKLCHASLIDGARLSGAAMRVFPHNDLEKLSSHLSWATDKINADGRILVITESIFSMDGDRAPLKEICELVTPSPALLLVDEAHAFGVIGPQGRGLAAELGLEQQIDLQMGTFSKAAGLSGGYLCGSRNMIDLLVNKARSFIYSTAPPPSLVATISDCLDLIAGSEGDEMRSRLWTNIRAFDRESTSAIVPFIIGENEPALAASQSLQETGYLVPAIRYPTVPRGTARLRITFSAAHQPNQVSRLKQAIATIA